jgi:hypothetical protein
MKLPNNYLGGDLFWWRESKELHTLITIRGDVAATNHIDPSEMGRVTLLFALHDTSGQLISTWERPVTEDQTIFLDSRTQKKLAQLSEGVLAVFALTDSPALSRLRRKYSRLFSLVDWYSDEGDIVSFHNDQSFRETSTPIKFTEIVVLESEINQNFLIVMNGPEAQAAGSIQLTVQNHSGQTREAIYQPALSPYSIHKLELGRLFPDLVRWSEDQHLTLAGQFDCKRLFVRPYIVTTGRRLSAYHGGNLYEWQALPRHVHKYLGRGEVNPMVALETDRLSTTVNLLNTHGDLEEDFWVDARLYDESGSLVADRERWLLARRHQLTRGHIADLLHNSESPFIGHIALNFSSDEKTFYPRRLQALLEYRTQESTARVMAWSDIWNGQEHLRTLSDSIAPEFRPVFLRGNVLPPPGVVYRSYYRMWYKAPIISYLAITNCGIAPGYDKTVKYRVRLENGRGDSLLYEGSVGPQATDYGPIDFFFPSIGVFLANQPNGMAIVESESDLAIMHLTHHQVSGAYSAEHFMDAGSRLEGTYYPSCGS